MEIKEVGQYGADVMAEELEGGEELKESVEILKTFMRPVNNGVQSVESGIRKGVNKAGAKAAAGRKPFHIKKVSKQIVKKASKDTAKKVSKETTKKAVKTTAKTTAKISAEVAVKAGATAAGSVVGPEGALIGLAAGELVGIKIDQQFLKMQSRSRIFRFIKTKMGEDGWDKDNLLKLLGHLLLMRLKLSLKYAIKYLLPILLVILSALVVLFGPVLFIVMIVSSPFAIFFQDEKAAETVQSVTSAYYREFEQAVSMELQNHGGYDRSEISYAGGITMQRLGENYNDVMAVYMVKHGIGETAAEMNDKTKKNLKKVFDDMVSYTTSSYTYKALKSRTVTDSTGKQTVQYYYVTYHVKTVAVRLRTYEEMISEYGFDDNKAKILEELMKKLN